MAMKALSVFDGLVVTAHKRMSSKALTQDRTGVQAIGRLNDQPFNGPTDKPQTGGWINNSDQVKR